MSAEPEMETNFVIVDTTSRHSSSVDMEGYSLLPDIIWTPCPDMLNSQYGKVIFTNVGDSYTTDEDLLCMYSIMSGIEVRDGDRVAIFCVGWTNVEEVITWVQAAKHPWPNEELSVVFPASQLPTPGTHFYQFCYLSAGEVRGASIPFNFVKKTNVSKEEQEKALCLRNHGLLGKSPQANIASTGDVCLHSVAAGHSQNLTMPANEGRVSDTHPVPTSDELARTSTAEADSSSPEVTSSEEYAPKSRDEVQKNMMRVSVESTSEDNATQAVASSSQGLNESGKAVPPSLCIPSGSKDSARPFHGLMDCTDMSVPQNVGSQLVDIKNDLQKNFLEMEREYKMLQSAMNAVKEENERLRACLKSEMEKNMALTENLQRTEAEVERRTHQYDVTRQNNLMIVSELENELDNQRMRIGELYNVISDKDRTIAYFSQRFGSVSEHPIPLGGILPFQAYVAGRLDEQLDQEVNTGANNGMQRQNIIPPSSPPPFNAALRKARNYYVTFLNDKSEIEKKVFALTCTKFSLVRKLHLMKERKDTLSRLEYQCYTALRDMHGVQNDDSIIILDALSEATAEQRDIDVKAFMEVDMLEEIKNRLEINKKNTCTLRAKAIEVFSKFLESFNYSTEHNNGAAQDEVGHIHALYAGLDAKFNDILCSIVNCVNKTYIWE